MPIPVGTEAPDFTLKSKTAEGLVDVALSSLRGKNVVLAFFPAAFTGVCTQEFCDLTGGLGAFSAQNAEVLGISCDTPFSLEAWAKANHIGIQLLSDWEHKVTEAYDVVLPNLAGIGPASQRALILIDAQGVVRYTQQTAEPGHMPNFDELNEALKTL